MSYGSEYLAETAFERAQKNESEERLYFSALADVSHGLWRCKDGRIMSVTEMETSHIFNCINMLERNNNPFRELYTKMFNEELERRTNEWAI